MSSTKLSVSEHGGELVVDSRLIAERLGIEHKNFLETLRRHQTKIEQRFGVIAFKTEKPLEGSQGGRPEKYALLTEPQATTLMTFSKNTEQVVECKLDLVEAFEKAKQVIKTVIPEQNAEIEKLKLQLAIAQANATTTGNQVRLVEKTESLAAFHGVPTALILLGRSDEVVEVEKPTLEVIEEKHKTYFKGQTLKQIAEYVNKRYGIKLKNGGSVKKILERLEKDNLIAHVPRAVVSEYVPAEHLDEVYKILTDGDRQMLLGE